MPVTLKLVEPGWTNFTGVLHNTAFVSGVAGSPVSDVKAAQIAAILRCEVSGVSGVQTGPTVGVAATNLDNFEGGGHLATENAHPSTEDLQTQINALQAQVDALTP